MGARESLSVWFVNLPTSLGRDVVSIVINELVGGKEALKSKKTASVNAKNYWTYPRSQHRRASCLLPVPACMPDFIFSTQMTLGSLDSGCSWGTCFRGLDAFFSVGELFGWSHPDLSPSKWGNIKCAGCTEFLSPLKDLFSCSSNTVLFQSFLFLCFQRMSFLWNKSF